MSAAIAPDVLELLAILRASNVGQEPPDSYDDALSTARVALDASAARDEPVRDRLLSGAVWALYALELHDAAAISTITIEISRNEHAPGNEHLNLEIGGGPVPPLETWSRINPVDPGMRAAAGSAPVAWTEQTNGTWLGRVGDLLVGLVYPHEAGGWGWAVYTTPPDVEPAHGVCEFRPDAFAAAEESHRSAG